MIIPGPICPAPDRDVTGARLVKVDGRPVFSGRHQLKPYADGTGFACVCCSRTWRWADKELVQSGCAPSTKGAP